ncbi:MAG: 50S ribosomal protein L6 [Patescibacteria group bacterium]|jgi:large subunit ribosomal protein L6
MSRLGKLPIELPKEVQARLDGDFIIVKGPKGELKEKINPNVKVEIAEGKISVSVFNSDNKKIGALWGLYRNLINNLVLGVSVGFEKKMEINGVGYKVASAGRKLILNVGYSHPVDFPLPVGIEGKVENNIITVLGIDKKLVGETAAKIRKIKEPEPYKGKGIKYVDEVIRRKEGKVAAGKSE